MAQLRNLPYRLSQGILRVYFGAKFKFDVTGIEHVPKTGAFIAASNHVSFLDPPVVGTACPRPLRFMARADLFRHAGLGAYLRAVRVIPLKRGETDMAAFRAALAALKSGDPVAIFPEGTRQLTGALGEAKRGVGLLAETAKVPIVPVYVHGTFDALPPTAKQLQPAKIRVAFGPVIPYNAAQHPSRQDHSSAGHADKRRHLVLAGQVTERWRQLAAQVSSPPR
jgi:1-acyl-sn-glycerol-3-phosphate acyltransferase